LIPVAVCRSTLKADGAPKRTSSFQKPRSCFGCDRSAESGQSAEVRGVTHDVQKREPLRASQILGLCERRTLNAILVELEYAAERPTRTCVLPSSSARWSV
jgi:hypothetical protein